MYDSLAKICLLVFSVLFHLLISSQWDVSCHLTLITVLRKIEKLVHTQYKESYSVVSLLRRNFCFLGCWFYILYFESKVSNFSSLFKISTLSLPLPPKKLIGNMEREFIAERQKGLQAYLDVITTHHILSNCELVKKFLDPNSYSVNYTGK